MTTLIRIDAEQNMARFYYMTILPDLFGGVQLIRQWGRIGEDGGQERCEYFENADLAQARHDELRDLKVRRGYAGTGYQIRLHVY